MKAIMLNCWRIALLLLLGVSAMPAIANSAADLNAAYSIEVKALQNAQYVTSVHITVKPNRPDIPPIGSIKHLQLKSYDTSGKLRWTKNENDVPVELKAAGVAIAKLTYSDMLPGQPVQIQLNVETAKRTEVIRASTVVTLLPDLAVDHVNVPGTVYVNQVVNILATLRELRGQSGAVASVALSAAGHKLDQAQSVTVAKNGTSDVLFATRFVEPGVYTLTVDIKGSNPDDYDESNNRRDVVIRVQNNVDAKAVQYDLRYRHWSGHEGSKWEPWFGSFVEHKEGEEQELVQDLYTTEIGKQLSFPITGGSLEVRLDDGKTVVTKEIGSIKGQFFRDGCVSMGAGEKDLGDGLIVTVQVSDFCGNKSTSVSLYQSASTVTHSDSFSQVYGSSDSAGGSGPLILRATKNVQTRLVLTGSNGVSIGGMAGIPVTSQLHEGSSTEVISGYPRQSYWKYTETTGNASGGMTQP